MTQELQMLVEFFKVLGNENRLKIIGLLAGGELTVRQIAELLHLKEPTVSEHLNALKELGLVSVRPDGNFRYYSFQPEPLRMLNKELFSREKLASLVSNVQEDDTQKLLRRFIESDRIVRIPANRKTWLLILEWLVERFEVGRQYTEKEVNEIIKQHHEDYATIRRDLVDWRYMAREKGIYWRTPEAERPVIQQG